MKNNRGLTLIEVIVSLAIIGIMSIAVLTIFNTGLKNIVSAGDRTEEVYANQTGLDAIIRENENKSDGTDKIKITIPGVIQEKEIKGKIIISEKLTTFVPNQVTD